MIVLKMAWRNIRRNPRRTLISVSAMGFGLSALLMQQSLVTGFMDKMVENSVKMHTGHVQIHQDGFSRREKLELTIDDPRSVKEAVEGAEGVEAFSERVILTGLVSSEENSVGVRVYGIDPASEREVTNLALKVSQGSYLVAGKRGSILMGSALAEELAVAPGDIVVIMTQALDGSLGAELFEVSGLFETGSPAFDQGAVYVAKQDAQDLVVMGSAISEFAIVTKDRFPVDLVVSELKRARALRGLEVLSWKDISPHLVQIIELEKTGLLIVLSIVFAIVCLGVVNTMLMSVMDRVREFGVMMSLGAGPGHIVRLILAEAFMLGLMGLAFGLVFGFAVVYYFSIHGIDLSEYSKAMSDYLPGETAIYPGFSLKYTLISAVAVMVTALIASLYPALKAARLKPVEAMRHL